MRGSPSHAKGPISARFPTFAEHGRKALAAANVPTRAASALDSSADRDLHTAEPADSECESLADMSTDKEPLAAAGQITEDAIMTDAASAPGCGAESDASSSSADDRLQSPAKKAKQVFPG